MVILAAVDGEERPDRVVIVADEIAEAFDDELVVLHVMSEAEVERRREEREYYVDQAAEDAARTAGWTVDGTLDDDENVRLEGRVGDPADEIGRLADDLDARYLVVGGRERTPVGKAVFGSITQAVLLDATCPVVTVID